MGIKALKFRRNILTRSFVGLSDVQNVRLRSRHRLNDNVNSSSTLFCCYHFKKKKKKKKKKKNLFFAHKPNIKMNKHVNKVRKATGRAESITAGRQQNKFVRPRWPYDMRPSAPAEKYIRDAGP